MLKKKKRRRNIFRFIWSVVWKLIIFGGITRLVIHLESKYNFQVPLYVSVCADIVSLILIFLSALKRGEEKFLKDSSTKK